MGLHEELAATLNRHCAENPSGTPDFILATYLTDCLNAFDKAVSIRDRWHGIGGLSELPPPDPNLVDYQEPL